MNRVSAFVALVCSTVCLAQTPQTKVNPTSSPAQIDQLQAKAKAGDPDAEYALGLALMHGQGVPQDQAQAAMWFRKAAEQDNAYAQFSLGVAYHTGEGMPQDYAQAAIWYRKAAEQGNALAQNNLGASYNNNGQGVPQDYAEAYFWEDLAAGKLDAANAQTAKENRDQTAAHLTPADISRAQERARKWFESHPAKL